MGTIVNICGYVAISILRVKLYTASYTNIGKERKFIVTVGNRYLGDLSVIWRCKFYG